MLVDRLGRTLRYTNSRPIGIYAIGAVIATEHAEIPISGRNQRVVVLAIVLTVRVVDR